MTKLSMATPIAVTIKGRGVFDIGIDHRIPDQCRESASDFAEAKAPEAKPKIVPNKHQSKHDIDFPTT